jgi:hypothetical protein
MGEAVHEAKFYFAPLNARADTDRMGWVACDEVMLGMQAGECSLQRRHFQHREAMSGHRVCIRDGVRWSKAGFA